MVCGPVPNFLKIHWLVVAVYRLDGSDQRGLGSRWLHVYVENSVADAGEMCIGHGVLNEYLRRYKNRFLCINAAFCAGQAILQSSCPHPKVAGVSLIAAGCADRPEKEQERG